MSASAGPDVRCEWGPGGLAARAPLSDEVVIVDVLSFATCVEVAVARGAIVYPGAWGDAGAAELAARLGAELAGPRGAGGLSLSPSSLQSVSPGTRIVLPSPNGAALTLAAAQTRMPVLAGCLRNAAAVARAVPALGRRVLVLAAGEWWPDGALRPCLEDWLGAGAVLDALPGRLSADAEAARAGFRAVRPALSRMLRECRSGQELIDRGWAEDVRLAAERDISAAVPVLREGAYRRLELT